MASNGTVDVIIQQQAIDNIAKANAALEVTLKNIIAINEASRKSSTTGNNPNSADNINKANKASTNQLKSLEKVRLEVIKLQKARENAFDKFEAGLQKEKSLREKQVNSESALRGRLSAQRKKEESQQETASKKQISRIEKEKKSRESQVNKESALRERLLTQRKKEEAATSKEEKLSKRLSGELNKALAIRNRLSKTIQDLNIKRNLGNKLTKKEEILLKISTAQFKRYDAAVRKTRKGVGRFNDSVGNYSKGMRGAIMAARSMASAMGLLGGAFLIVSVIRSASKTIIEFNRQLIAVGKTTDLSKDALKSFGQQAINLGLQLKGISTLNLLKTAEVAGQLGIRGSKNILKFSETIEKLALTSDIVGQESARAFAKFIELSDDTVESADKLGSVITDLGNNFATTEGEILKNTTEIQRGIAIYNTSAQSVIALGAATSALGGQAEASRGALQKTFKVLNEGATQGKNLEKILRLTGQTAEEFKEEFGRDAVSVFSKFIKGLSESDKAGKNLSNTLVELGLDEKRTEAVVGSLAKNYDTLESALSRANIEYENSIALNKEYEAATESLASNIGDMEDAWDNFILSVERGDGAISEFLKREIGQLTEVIKVINEWNRSQQDVFDLAENAGYEEVIRQARGEWELMIADAKRFNESGQDVTFLEDLAFELGVLEQRLKDVDNGFRFEEADARLKEIKRLLRDVSVADLGGKDGVALLLDEQKRLELLIKANGQTEKNINFIKGQIRATKELIKLEEERGGGLEGIEDVAKKTIDFYEDIIRKTKELRDSTAETNEEYEAFNKTILDAENGIQRLKVKFQELIEVQSVSSPGLATLSPTPSNPLRDSLESTRRRKAGIISGTDENGLVDRTPQVTETEGVEGSAIQDFLGSDEFQFAKDTFDSLIDLGNMLFDARIALIDAEIQANEDKYNLLFLMAEGDAEQQRLLAIQQEKERQKLEKKKRKELKKQAIINKAAAIVEIGINTAIAITNALGFGPPPVGIALAAIVGAIGVAQIATVIASPIPQFAKGGTMDKDGLAVVGDGGRKEVIKNPDGSIQVTPNKSTVVGLQKGAEIFPSIDAFNQEMPTDISDQIYSATVMASLSINNAQMKGYMQAQRVLDEKLLDAMLLNTQAIKKQKLNVRNNNSINLEHLIYKEKYTN